MSLTTVRLREAWNWSGLTLKELAVRTYRQMDAHETLDRAAAVAYYAMLSLPPFLGLLLATLVGGRGRFGEQLQVAAHQYFPAEAATIIESQIEEIKAASPAGLLSFASVVLLWSASGAFVGVMDATNAAYGVRDHRPWWWRRLIAAVLTAVELALLAAALTSIVAWPYLARWLGLGGVAAILATVLFYVAVVVVLLVIFAVAYYFGPDVKREWEWITPGSALGILFLIASSLALRVYVSYGGSFSASYGALAGVIVTLLWLYAAALALLTGAEINCVIEQATPGGGSIGQTGGSPQADVPVGDGST
jgi:membrane protein